MWAIHIRMKSQKNVVMRLKGVSLERF